MSFPFTGTSGNGNDLYINRAYGNFISIIAGILGSVSLLFLTNRGSIIVSAFSIFGFGLSFILIHSTMVATAQAIIPHLRGTIMALVSLSTFMGSSIGTLVYHEILASSHVLNIFRLGSILFFITGITGYFVLNYVHSKKVALFSPWKTTWYNCNGPIPGSEPMRHNTLYINLYDHPTDGNFNILQQDGRIQ